MADLRSRYLGLDLRTPLVASASPMTGTLGGLPAPGGGGRRWLVLFNRFYQPDLDLDTLDWLEEHGMDTVGHPRGLRSQRSVRDPAA